MRKIPFLRLTTFFILGIFIQEYFQLGLSAVLPLLSVISVATLSSYFISLRHNKFILSFGVFSIILFFLFGIYISEIQKIEYNKSHYSHYLDKGKNFEGKIVNAKKAKYSRYVIEVSAVDNENNRYFVNGKIQLTSKNSEFEIGDIVAFNANLREFDDISNEYSFDFKNYIEGKGVHYQAFTEEINLLERKKSRLNSWKHLISKEINNLSISDESEAVLFAMILGKKDNLGKLEKTFRNTGTSHVLAISGLHVGIIAALLFFLLSFIPPRFDIVKYAIVIVGVWIFCLLSGMASSTIRASIMISCFLIGKSFKLQGFGYNFCFLAAFLMLFQQPKLIYDIGFQFSFLAILGILYFFEPLYKTFVFKGLADRVWQMSILSFSAQLTITPLSLYYFHQFPILFALTSLIAIPATFVIVSIGLLSIFLSLLCGEVSIISTFLDWFIQAFINLLDIFSSQESMLLDNLWPSSTEIFLYYICLFSISTFFLQNKRFGLHSFIIGFVLLLGNQFVINDQLNRTELVFYADKKNIIIDLINAGQVVTFYESGVSQKKIDWKTQGQHVKSNCRDKKSLELTNTENHTLTIEGYKILIINQWSESIGNIQADFILINCKAPQSYCPWQEAKVVDFAANLFHPTCNSVIYRNKQFKNIIQKSNNT